MNEIAIINKRPGRLWQVLQFPVTRIAILVAAMAAIIAAVLFLSSAAQISSRSVAGISRSLIEIACLCGVYVALVRYIEQRRAEELGLPRAWREFGLGFSIGMALFCGTMLALYLLGFATFGRAGSWGYLVYPLAAALATAFFEEILIRGVLFRIIEESLGSWIALALSAAVFGALHGANPGATFTSCAAIALEAGVLLAAAYMYTRRLWMAIGLHAAWNFTEGGIFGASVSGGRSHGLLATQISGGDIVSGGQFGPEASVVAVILCLVAATILITRARSRGHFVKPFWLRMPR